MIVTACVLIGLIIALVSNRFRASYVFVAAVAMLYVSGEITQTVIFSNVTNRSVVILLLLLLSSLALERTALLSWAAKMLSHRNYWQSLLRLGIVSAVSSGMLNNTAVVATLMGSVLKNPFHAPKKLLIPLSYFSILGGTLTLIGTATNLVVSGLLEDQGYPGLSIFAFFPVGASLLVGCGLMVVIASRWLPDEPVKAESLGDYFLDAEVDVGSKLVGKSVLNNGLRSLDGLFLTEIIRDKQLISPVSPSELILSGDKLVFSGDVSEVKQLSTFDGLKLYVEEEFELDKNLVEVLVSPESVLIGRTLKEVGFRSRFDAAVVAIARQGKRISGKLGECSIQSGDKFILAVGDDFKKRPNLSRNFFLLSNKSVKSPLSLPQNVLGIVGFISAIILAAYTNLDLIETLSGFLLLSLVSRIIDGTQLRRRFPFELLAILVSALCIASAFSSSGLAIALTQTFESMAGNLSPNWMLVGILVLTILLTEIMTNTAAAAIMLPIALALASTFNVGYLPLVMAVAYGASASFISPFGYQTNLMVMNAGGYALLDFMKVGWLVTATYIAIAAVAIPMVFPF
ncbi:SLC13 family permease [Vibrio crassostreae]|uniref:SLC13 family permease n=1 Tax=Vibrio crassostreae TaxID=246167 RepID=UPI000F49A8D6|nr:SLC13 family permease [Vibrio crassostreae]ROO48923.1 di/tricarboxylate transporter [Vibrio crassostreae]ROO49187.1 di/tricarboxylate transporter [Vibrio crassostreae]ROO66459.1 di/tricarboxylate transporter [Vibrio crassostreae]ROO68289.1 di/tricarboxylate transporter [Vibrio crassostreae]ROR62401.1 di/tricarboxylate transporter [Vibrio crassostreae]